MISLDSIKITMKTLMASDYKSLINTCEQNVFQYFLKLSEAEQEERNKGNITKADALYLISQACSLLLDVSNHKEPFKPYYNSNNSRSAILSDFSCEQGELLASFALKVNDPELASRLADVGSHISRTNIKLVKFSIINYINASENSYCQKNWHEKIKRLERALRLSIKINDEQHKELIVKKLLDCIDNNSNAYDLQTAVDICKMLLDTNIIDSMAVAEKAHFLATQVANTNAYIFKCSLLEIAAKGFSKNKDYVRAEKAKLDIAETLLQKAEQAERSGGMILASHYYEQAINVLQNCKGQKERIKEIQPKIEMAIKESFKEMKAISAEIDTLAISKIIFERSKVILHEDRKKTLIFFALFLDTPLKKKWLEEAALEIANNSPISSRCRIPIYNGDGRLVAIREPLLGSNGKKYTDALKAASYSYAEILYKHSLPIILHLRDEIKKHHEINKQAIFEILQKSSFLPPDRLNIWTKGILAGFNHEFDIALCLLIPQFEHALRKVLEARGAIVWRIESDTGLHSELLLNQLLELKEAGEFLGEDLQFELQGLLVDRLGFNYRNELAHGLMPEAKFYSPAAIYLWWLLLHIIVRCNQATYKEMLNTCKDEMQKEVPIT